MKAKVGDVLLPDTMAMKVVRIEKGMVIFDCRTSDGTSIQAQTPEALLETIQLPVRSAKD